MYKKGTIVLIPFPFTNLSGNKVRPALIISKGKIGDDVVVVFITAQKKLKGKHLVAIDPDGHNGLKTPSKIVCAKIATLDTRIILGKLGIISKSTQQKVDATLQQLLDV